MSVLIDIFMESIHEITSQQEPVEILETGTSKIVQVNVPMWNESIANVTLLALGSSCPEIFLCFFSMFIDIDATPNPTGPMVLVGSAGFNVLVVMAVAILGANEIKGIERMGPFVVTAIFSMFAYCWFFIVLCLSTPGYIDFWEAIATLCLYFVLVLSVYATEKLNPYALNDDINEQNANRRLICRHTLVQMAKQYGEQYVLNLVINPVNDGS
jgi:solute carrier family 8 (sodium/calcium exchanger)